MMSLLQPPDDEIEKSTPTEASDFLTKDPTRLALDMDSVLADSMNTVFEYMAVDATREDVETWEWPIEQFGADEFLGTFDKVWTHKWYDVPPMEDGLPSTVATISDLFAVDIVTAQPDHDGVTDGKAAWLDYHEIPYDNLVTVPRNETKADLGYDIYIDDKPSLPSRVAEKTQGAEMILRDQPYNREVDGEYVRIDSLEEGVRYLIWGTTAENPEEEIQHV